MERQPIDSARYRNLHSTIFGDGQHQFSRIIKPLTILLTFLGLRPYSSRNSQVNISSAEKKECLRSLKTFFNQFVTYGFIFWLPWLLLGCRATFLSIESFINSMMQNGFFNPATVNAMQTWLIVQNGWIFVIYSFISARKFINLIRQLDQIVLSDFALKKFRIVTVRTVVGLLITILFYSAVNVCDTIIVNGSKEMSAGTIFNFSTTLYVSLLCFTGPTAWIDITLIFIAQGFKENRHQLKEAMRNQNDTANIRRIFFDYLRLTEIVEIADAVFAPIVLISVTIYVVLLCTSILNITAVSDHFTIAAGYIFILVGGLLNSCFRSIYLNDIVSFLSLNHY
jgi:hypothetical protein